MCCCMLIADCVCVSAAPIVQYCCPLSGQKSLPPWVRLSFHVIYVIKLPTLGVPRPAPPPFRPGNPALCGSHLLVTPYYCRLGDLLCFVFMCPYCIFLLIEYSVFLEYFDAVGWVFWPVKTVGRITYTVLVETLNHAQSIYQPCI